MYYILKNVRGDSETYGKIRKNFQKLKDEYTTLPLKEVIGSNAYELKYFNPENNDKILQELAKVIPAGDLPILGIKVYFGLGDFCLEEATQDSENPLFKVYTIDRRVQYDYSEHTNVKDAIERLAQLYVKYNFISNIEEMTDVFFNVLDIEKTKKTTFTRKKHM